MSKLVFCKFLDSDGNPRGRDYTYKSDFDVFEGDYVEVEKISHSGEVKKKKVIVSKSEVSPEEIDGYDSFKDRIVTISGLWHEEPKVQGGAEK